MSCIVIENQTASTNPYRSSRSVLVLFEQKFTRHRPQASRSSDPGSKILGHVRTFLSEYRMLDRQESFLLLECGSVYYSST